MAKVLFGPIVSEARNKQGSVVFSRGPYGAYTRAWVDPDQTETPARKTAKDRLAAAAAAWNNSLTAGQRAAWEVFAKLLDYRDTFGARKDHPGRPIFLQQYLYLDNLSLPTLTDPPPSTERLHLASATLDYQWLYSMLQLNLAWPSGQAQPPVIIYATPCLNPAVNSPGHRFKQIAALPANATYPYELCPSYSAVFGTPTWGDKIFVRARPVHPTTGLTGVPLMAHSTDPQPADGCRVYHDANQTIPNAAWTALAFNSQRYDNGGLHDTAINNSRITAQKAGKYHIWAGVTWEPNTAGVRLHTLRLNGLTFIAITRGPVEPHENASYITSTIWHLQVGDYVELVVYQSSGGNLSVLADPAMSPEFAAQMLST